MFSRLNNGRFDEEALELEKEQQRHAEQDAANNNGKNKKTSGAASATSTMMSTKTSVVGSSQARFLGEYNPLLNKPLERRDMNSDVVLLPELTKALADLRNTHEYNDNHKKKDSVKGYLDEVAKFSAATKFRK